MSQLIRIKDKEVVFASCHLESDGFIHSLLVTRQHRGKGLGTAILRLAVINAVKLNVTPYLRPAPFDNSPLSLDLVKQWYSRHGFIDRDETYMVRLCNRHMQR